MLVFAVLVYGTMKWIWPLILGAMEERSRKIAAGLAAAEEGEKKLSEARSKAETVVREARERASHIIEQAQHAARDLVEQAKGVASSEGARILAAAQQQIELDTTRTAMPATSRLSASRARVVSSSICCCATRAREALRREVAGIAVR